MIRLTRRLARRLRAILGRPTAGVTLLAVPRGIRVIDHGEPLCLEYTGPGVKASGDPVGLPQDALGELAGPDHSPILLEAAGPGRTAARWAVGGIAQSRLFVAPRPSPAPQFPASPAALGACGPEILDALAAAVTLAGGRRGPGPEFVLVLRGGASAIVAADGHQVLTLGDCPLPWPGDVATRPWPVLVRAGRAGGGRIALGRTASHLVLRSGAWTVWAESLPLLRWWSPASATPTAAKSGATAWFSLADEDARLLRRVLAALPGADLPGGPVNLICRGVVRVRAAGRGDGLATELILGRSRADGAAASIVTARADLGRALALGFTRFVIAGPAGPLTGLDGPRQYTWSALDG